MSDLIATDEPPEAVRLMVRVYACLLLAGFAFVPAYLIARTIKAGIAEFL